MRRFEHAVVPLHRPEDVRMEIELREIDGWEVCGTIPALAEDEGTSVIFKRAIAPRTQTEFEDLAAEMYGPAGRILAEGLRQED